ncbi:MAG: hypothetical protein HYR70_07925 [Chloroflexi bacterium]|nr:hypothetical protein [Chloroflexota bacterium]
MSAWDWTGAVAGLIERTPYADVPQHSRTVSTLTAWAAFHQQSSWLS